MDKNFRKKEMNFSLFKKFESIKWSRKRESGVVFTPRHLLVILCGMIGWYVTILLIGDKKTIEEANLGLQFLFYAISILFASSVLILVSIFVYDKILQMRSKFKQIIKSPEYIKLLEKELQSIDNPKMEHLGVKSALGELLIRVKNIQEKTIPENNKRMDKLEIKNHDLTVENIKFKNEIVKITKELLQIKQLIHQNNEGV